MPLVAGHEADTPPYVPHIEVRQVKPGQAVAQNRVGWLLPSSVERSLMIF